jgi:hypothetical protein
VESYKHGEVRQTGPVAVEARFCVLLIRPKMGFRDQSKPLGIEQVGTGAVHTGEAGAKLVGNILARITELHLRILSLVDGGGGARMPRRFR